MTRRLACLLSAAALLSGCSTMSGTGDLFGYPTQSAGLLASAPELAAVQPLPTLPAPGAAPVAAAAVPLSPAPISAGTPAPRRDALAPTPDEVARESMVAAALAPAASHQSLGELDRNADGSMVLPAGRSLEIIDIAPIRTSFAAADDLPPTR